MTASTLTDAVGKVDQRARRVCHRACRGALVAEGDDHIGLLWQIRAASALTAGRMRSNLERVRGCPGRRLPAWIPS